MAGASQSQWFQQSLPISHQEDNDFKGVAGHPCPPAVPVKGEDAALTQQTQKLIVVKFETATTPALSKSSSFPHYSVFQSTDAASSGLLVKLEEVMQSTDRTFLNWQEIVQWFAKH